MIRLSGDDWGRARSRNETEGFVYVPLGTERDGFEVSRSDSDLDAIRVKIGSMSLGVGGIPAMD